MDPKLKPIITFVIVSLAIIAISIPLLLNKVPPNCVYGVRTRKTLSDPEVWYKANRFGAKCLIVSSLITLISCVLMYFHKNNLSFQDVHLMIMNSLVAPLVVAIVLTLLYVKKL